VFTILSLVALIAAFAAGFLYARARGATTASATAGAAPATPPAAATTPTAARAPSPPESAVARSIADADAGTIAERARLIRSGEAETAALRRTITGRDAELAQLRSFAAERRHLLDVLARAGGDTARYRQLVVDMENNAPSLLFDAPGSPDDLKLIVGIGPVLERMLHQLGVGSYRQIARWTDRDIDAFDTRLPEFPGRIRRDAWVVQARALHRSKYGETLPLRERGA
jgi:predicted flap endonuclease-1-like 5' DNA nuclease